MKCKRSLPVSPLIPLLFAALAAAPIGAATSPDGVWHDVGDGFNPPTGERLIVPQHYRTLRLDWSALEPLLAAAPLENSGELSLLDLPLPDGRFGRFAIEESPIMEPELAIKFPEIRTYRGRGLDDPTATVRFDRTPHGFHAQILSAEGRVFIDPYSRGETSIYISYFTRDHDNPEARAGRRCDLERANPQVVDRPQRELRGGGLPSGDTLRSYRLAVAATGEYTTFHGGTVDDGMAAIVVAMNRVNGVYERDVAIRMLLVANNDLIVYTDAGSDPYTNSNGGLMLGENQVNLDAVIGDPNYDIGHVFSTGGGGIASLAVPCVTGSKARGVTGLPSPAGDVFYIDFVAHEMGHQWDGNHTFNGNAGNCFGGNRNASTAYEPGSGSTIMAYAGICNPQNLQTNSDDYFHTISYEEIVEYSTLGFGDTCAQRSPTGNSPPIVEAGADFTIPLETPFELCGSATDPDGDTLTFSWEEFDLGPPGPPDSPIGDAPIFRSFQPTTSPCRTFPRLSDLVDGTQTIGELLPTYNRNLKFRLTVRDNRPEGGGVDFDSNALIVDTSGPFRVTAPNVPVIIPAGSEQSIQWDPAGTDTPPVDCTAVDILLSTNRGGDYLFELASGTPNDGAEAVTIPDAPTDEGRFKVRCSDNVFFDISDADFRVETTTETELALVGDCPGPVTMAVDGASPNASVAVVWSTALGTTIVPSGPCAGTELNLDAAQIGRFVTVDGGGATDITVDVPATACGRVVQLVDMSNCAVSNLSGLQ